MIVVDSSVLIAWIRGADTPETKRLASLHPRQIVIGDIILLEVLRGARDEAQARKLEANLQVYEIASMLDSRLAIKAASYYRRLRALGHTIRTTPDLIIATFCIEHGHELLQDDRDFLPMAEHLGLILA